MTAQYFRLPALLALAMLAIVLCKCGGDSQRDAMRKEMGADREAYRKKWFGPVDTQ